MTATTETLIALRNTLADQIGRLEFLLARQMCSDRQSASLERDRLTLKVDVIDKALENRRQIASARVVDFARWWDGSGMLCLLSEIEALPAIEPEAIGAATQAE